MKLFLDDTRPFPSEGFECCRDAGTAKLLLGSMAFDFISLDYDLGGGRTGLEVLEFMKERRILVPHINIHSSHFSGRYAMRDFCLENFPDSTVTMNMLA